MAASRGRREVRRMPPEKRVADIMNAARSVLVERGIAEAFVSEVAERAGIVEGSIYRFFSNKRDLVEKVVENWYEEMLADYFAHFEAIVGARNQLRFIIHHHLMSIKKEPTLSRLVFLELRPAENYRSTRVFELNQAYTKRVVDVVKAAIRDGEFRSDISPTLVRDMIFGGIEHRVWAFLRNEGDFDASKTADAITDFICRALSAADDAPIDRTSSMLARIESAAEQLERIVGSTREARRVKS